MMEDDGGTRPSWVGRSPGTPGLATWQGFHVDGWRVAALPEATGQIEQALALQRDGT